MKKYKISDLPGNRWLITMLILVCISEINEHTLFKLFWTLLIIIKIVYINKYSYYIIKENCFITRPSGKDIEILKIKSIHKRKFYFINKYFCDFKLSQFDWISIYPLQSDIDTIINDLIQINPNIIVKEYKS
jgi:hypothetical protein